VELRNPFNLHCNIPLTGDAYNQPRPRAPHILAKTVTPSLDSPFTSGVIRAYNSSGGEQMKRVAPVLLVLLSLGARPGAAQKAPGAGLTAQQMLGRRVLAQSCAVCHLPPAPDAKTYGPPLNKVTIPEEDEAVRETILEGTTRMPGFKYF